MSSEIHVDIETLDTLPSAAILSIGAAEVETETGKVLDTFSVNIAQEPSFGRTVSSATLAWWGARMKELEAATTGGVPLYEGLAVLAKWLSPKGNPQVWAKSPNFDMVILEDAYNYVSPFDFRKFRDIRTLDSIAELVGVDLEELSSPPSHVALEDAVNQGTRAAAILRYLRRMAAKCNGGDMSWCKSWAPDHITGDDARGAT